MIFREISDKVKAGLAGIVLLGSTVTLTGCRTGADARYNSGLTTRDQYIQEKTNENNYNNGLGLSLLGGLIGARGLQVGNPGAVVFGDALARHGAATANSPNVVVNNNVPNITPVQYVQVPQAPPIVHNLNVKLIESPNREPLVLRKDDPSLGKMTMVVSNYCRDFNRDGVLNYPEDYGGMKRVFLPSENITLSIASSNPAGSLRIDLLGTDGSKIDSIDGKGLSLLKEYSFGKNQNFPREGIYSGTFYAEGQFLGKLEFEVTDKKWEFVSK